MCAGAGCTLGPDYVRPAVDVPSAYRFADAPAPVSTAAATLAEVPAWWRAFGDDELDALVDEGLAANHDLRLATARVDEFAAAVTATHAQALPQAGYGATAQRQRVSRETASLPAGVNPVGQSYSALLSASWELDLWGRIRRQDEAARANLLATEQARLGVALTLVSTIVSGYVTLLDLDGQLVIAQATLDGRKLTVDVFQKRLDGGAISEFEMMQVTAEYETAVASIPVLQQAIAQQEHALSVLVGRNPGPIRRGGNLLTLVAPPVPAGLPSELISRRPDILQAEQQLVASNALIGAARALYFPTLALTATGGSASRELDNLFTGPAHTWSFAGQLLGPLFAGGAIDAANRQALARRDQALEVYQETIQNAFRDVDDALAAIQAKRALVASLERQVAALTRAVQLTRERYDNGYTDYLEVLDTERSLFSAQLSLSSARGDGFRSLVDLYRALGGDWIGQVAPLPVAQQPAARPRDADAARMSQTRLSHP
ncbi:efflux transporter outer membrane subunit [Dyella soli]|uniref:Efflux transporter outer membrane subunit n=2 Tax=Dyella soli TaxID=522319 RepID=A0A4R0YKT7_9GAMM|nr:efflux transporter outer membrane subunit [Dyella soli]